MRESVCRKLYSDGASFTHFLMIAMSTQTVIAIYLDWRLRRVCGAAVELLDPTMLLNPSYDRLRTGVKNISTCQRALPSAVVVTAESVRLLVNNISALPVSGAFR